MSFSDTVLYIKVDTLYIQILTTDIIFNGCFTSYRGLGKSYY